MSIQSDDEFFGELKEWSERKLKILTNYLAPFSKILKGATYYVDAFAGAGLYQDGQKGSALRAAEIARGYQTAGEAYRLNGGLFLPAK